MGDALQLVSGLGPDGDARVLVLQDSDYMFEDHVGEATEPTPFHQRAQNSSATSTTSWCAPTKKNGPDRQRAIPNLRPSTPSLIKGAAICAAVGIGSSLTEYADFGKWLTVDRCVALDLGLHRFGRLGPMRRSFSSSPPRKEKEAKERATRS
jgi:hypothetical protein